MSKLKEIRHLLIYGGLLFVSMLDMLNPNVWCSIIESLFFLQLTVGEMLFKFQGSTVMSAYDRIEELEHTVNEKDKLIITQQRVVIELEDMLNDARAKTDRKTVGKFSVL